MAQAAVRSRREERSAQIRADLLAAAERLLAEKGFDRTTISDITSEAGLGFGTFYNYFASKEELYQELVLSGLGLIQERIDERCALTEDHSLRLGIMTEEVVSFATQRPDLFLLLFTTNSDLHTAVREGIDAFRRSLIRWIEEGQAAGRFIGVDAPMAASAVIGVYAFVLRPVGRKNYNRSHIEESLHRLIKGALTAA
jgi:AcrR family transcriptional regulator